MPELNISPQGLVADITQFEPGDKAAAGISGRSGRSFSRTSARGTICNRKNSSPNFSNSVTRKTSPPFSLFLLSQLLFKPIAAGSFQIVVPLSRRPPGWDL